MRNRSLKQTVISLSSCEAEIYAVSTCAGEFLGLTELFKELHYNVSLRLRWIQIRHVTFSREEDQEDSSTLNYDACLYNTGSKKRLSVGRVNMKDNTADIFTKFLGGPRTQSLSRKHKHTSCTVGQLHTTCTNVLAELAVQEKVKCTTRRLVHGHLPSITRRGSGHQGGSARPWPRTSGKGARPNVTTVTYHNWPNSYAAGTQPSIPLRTEAYQLRSLRRESESCGDSAPLDGLASRGVFPSAGCFHIGTQWPDKPATRRKQMRECLSGRVVDVRSGVCWVYHIVKHVTR